MGQEGDLPTGEVRAAHPEIVHPREKTLWKEVAERRATSVGFGARRACGLSCTAANGVWDPFKAEGGVNSSSSGAAGNDCDEKTWTSWSWDVSEKKISRQRGTKKEL